MIIHRHSPFTTLPPTQMRPFTGTTESRRHPQSLNNNDSSSHWTPVNPNSSIYSSFRPSHLRQPFQLSTAPPTPVQNQSQIQFHVPAHIQSQSQFKSPFAMKTPYSRPQHALRLPTSATTAQYDYDHYNWNSGQGEFNERSRHSNQQSFGEFPASVTVQDGHHWTSEIGIFNEDSHHASHHDYVDFPVSSRFLPVQGRSPFVPTMAVRRVSPEAQIITYHPTPQPNSQNIEIPTNAMERPRTPGVIAIAILVSNSIQGKVWDLRQVPRSPMINIKHIESTASMVAVRHYALSLTYQF